MPVFMQDWYLDAVCENGAWSGIVGEENGKQVAAWPFFVKRKYGFCYITMPLLVKYMGPWRALPARDLNTGHTLYTAMSTALPKVDMFKQNFHYSVTNWLPWYWQGFRQQAHYTYLLDIQDLNRVNQGINRNMRRNIQGAQQTLRLVLDNDPERFWALNELSFTRKQLRPPYSKALFLRHDAALGMQGQRQIFFAVDEHGRTHSGAYLIWDAHSAYYHLSGDDPALRQSGSGIWLVWEAIRYAQEVLELGLFDFEGSMLPEVEAIRRQFGALQTPYSFIWRYHNPVLRVLGI